MKKLFVLLFVILLTLSVCGCGNSTEKSDDSSVSSAVPFSSDETNAETSKITEEEAIEIASAYWNIKNGEKDEETGYPFLIMPMESKDDVITIALKWLVENNHYSTLDTVQIDLITGKIIEN